MRTWTLASALLLTALSYPGLAQSLVDHEAHHPDQKEAPAAKSAAPPETPRSMPTSQGMMEGGMMNMMGGNMPMSNMMGMMRQSGGDGMGGMEAIDHVEGRIAFLRTELKITDAQAPAWNAFADALRTNAKALGEIRASMMSPAAGGSPTVVERLAVQEKWLVARLDGLRSTKSALTSLVATFSDEQKKSADELLAPRMGMMPFMSGAGGPTMGMGRMQSGKPGQ